MIEPSKREARSLDVRVTRLSREQQQVLERHGCRFPTHWASLTITFPVGTRRVRLPDQPGLDLVASYHTILPDGFSVTETALSDTLSVLFADPMARRAAIRRASRPSTRQARLARLSSAFRRVLDA